MTDQELDSLMRRVLMDAIRKDEEAEIEETDSFTPSRKHQRQMKKMLADPLKWMRNKTKPVWKKFAQKVAVVLLIVSVSLGGVMAVSPTVRAAVIRWVTEWYETHIVYFFSGEANSEELLKYEIANIPETFVETDRIENTSSVSIFYEDNCGGVICFDYVYMHQGGATLVITDDQDVIAVSINGLPGQLVLPTEKDATTTAALIWIDNETNIQFVIETTLNEDAIISMAESVRVKE